MSGRRVEAWRAGDSRRTCRSTGSRPDCTRLVVWRAILSASQLTEAVAHYGCLINGDGFLLSPDEARKIIESDHRNRGDSFPVPRRWRSRLSSRPVVQPMGYQLPRLVARSGGSLRGMHGDCPRPRSSAPSSGEAEVISREMVAVRRASRHDAGVDHRTSSEYLSVPRPRSGGR